MNTTTSDLMSRVAKGAAWLDANRDGWYRIIHADTLEMHDCVSCVLGQLFRSFQAGVKKGYPDAPLDDEAYKQEIGPIAWAIEHGFSLSSSETDMGSFEEGGELWEELRAHWLDAIRRRQEEWRNR